MRLFQDSFIFGEATSSHFFRVTTSTQQLLSRSSYFFRTAAFLRSSFFRTVTFSQLLFQNSFFFTARLLQGRHSLRIGSCLGQLLIETAIFLEEELFRKKDIYRRATFSKQVLLHIINFFRKATFWKKRIIQKSNTFPFFERPLFQKTQPSIAFTFSEDLPFYKILFQKSYFTATLFSTATILIYLLVIKWALFNVQFKPESSFLCIYYCSKSYYWCLTKVSWLNKVRRNC